MGILDKDGTEVVSYTYDSWGAPISTTGTLAETIGKLNPFRYRGYYYDAELGLYSLQSRYYDPFVGRFLNADDTDTLLCSLNELTDKNLFAYCDNNPIMRIDNGGDFWMLIGAAVGAVVGGAISAISQYATTGEINWGVVLVNVASGAVSGALASTGIGLSAAIAVNTGLSVATYSAEQAVKGEKITVAGVAKSAVAGAIGGVIGGKGVNAKGLSASWKSASKGIVREARRANVKYAAKQTAKYTAVQTAIKKEVSTSFARYIASGMSSQLPYEKALLYGLV